MKKQKIIWILPICCMLLSCHEIVNKWVDHSVKETNHTLDSLIKRTESPINARSPLDTIYSSDLSFDDTILKNGVTVDSSEHTKDIFVPKSEKRK